jgi:Ca-activated chloride channel family protein
MNNASPKSDDPLRHFIRQALEGDGLSPSAQLHKLVDAELTSSATKAESGEEAAVPPVSPVSPLRKSTFVGGRGWLAALVSLAAVALLVVTAVSNRWRSKPPVEQAQALPRPQTFLSGTAKTKSDETADAISELAPLLPDAPTSGERLLKEAQQPQSESEVVVVDVPVNDVNAAAAQIELHEFGEAANARQSLAKEVGGLKGTGLSGRGAAAKGYATVPSCLAGSTPKANETFQGRRFADVQPEPQQGAGGENYAPIVDNPFRTTKGEEAVSTFSIDVDTASYANVRRFLTQGRLPPRDAVRIEELLNYFVYDYPQPEGERPFSVNMEVAPCPWQSSHLLLRVGLKGKEVHREERPASNLVFLVDVSGSMSSADKLPLLKQSLQMLVRELTPRDRVTIVTYAGDAGLRLEPTSGQDKATIESAIDSLQSGGSTNGSAGIQLAYEKAREGFLREGTNRVILCTDGDLNVGITRDEELVDLITREAKSDVFLTVLGFGQGNLQDAKMEKLADRGNGVYAYIDGVREARKVLVEQMSGSLVTIAKDVKVQIEFNPAQVQSYRLIGYENRLLARQDFADDKKDAGEIGAGHTVTALYELVPADVKDEQAVPPLKYQRDEKQPEQSQPAEGAKEDTLSRELLTLKLRYKQPDADTSTLLEVPLTERGENFSKASEDFRFAASVAAFGMALRQSPHRGDLTIAGIAEIAGSSLGRDPQGYRAEFLDLVRRAADLGVK